MIDIKLIRENPELVSQRLKKRGEGQVGDLAYSFEELLQWDARRRELIQQTESLKMQRNQANDQIKQLRAGG